MDLSKILCEKINSIEDLPYTCFLNYLSGRSGLSLVPSSGSTDVKVDWAGNATKKINYIVAIRGHNNSALLERTLWRIINVLENIKAIASEDNSFIFRNLIVNELPSLTYQDANNYSQYEISFSVFIFQTKQQIQMGV